MRRPIPPISVDARESGSGKTTDVIYKKLDKASSINRIIVIVPSIALQDQYKAAYKNAKIINSTTSENVQKKLGHALAAEEKIICITHEAWLQSSIPYHYRQYCNLIADEALPIFNAWKYKCKESRID